MQILRSPSKRLAVAAEPGLLPQGTPRAPVPGSAFPHPLRALTYRADARIVFGDRTRGTTGQEKGGAPHPQPAWPPSLHPGIINPRVRQLFVCLRSLSRAAFSLLLIHPS